MTLQLSSTPMARSTAVENAGSTARDWCMLERNMLSHIKLGLLLSLLSSAILLHARLSTSADSTDTSSPIISGFSLALILTLSALAALAAGTWEYWSSDRDMRSRRAFMHASKPHVAMLTIVSGVVFTICIILLADESVG